VRAVVTHSLSPDAVAALAPACVSPASPRWLWSGF